jgi:uncharacterized membrane protein
VDVIHIFNQEDNMHQLNDVFIVGIIFFTCLGIIKVLSDNRLRSKLIEKGHVDESIKALYSRQNVLSSLKWGFVLVGLGLALLLSQLLPVDVREEVIVGSMFLLAGVGLLSFYYLSNRIMKKED